MKRRRAASERTDLAAAGAKKKPMQKEKLGETPKEIEAVLLDENLLYEILRRVDGRTVARSACVSRQWKRTTHNERLWGVICMRHTSSPMQLVLALRVSSFHRLYSGYLWPLVKPSKSKVGWGSGEMKLWMFFNDEFQ